MAWLKLKLYLTVTSYHLTSKQPYYPSLWHKLDLVSQTHTCRGVPAHSGLVAAPCQLHQSSPYGLQYLLHHPRYRRTTWLCQLPQLWCLHSYSQFCEKIIFLTLVCLNMSAEMWNICRILELGGGGGVKWSIYLTTGVPKEVKRTIWVFHSWKSSLTFGNSKLTSL